MTVDLDPSLRFEDERLGQLLDWWRAAAAALGHLPGRTAFDPVAMKALLPNVYMVDVVDGGARWRWRLIGTSITDLAGRDATGRFFDDLYPAAALADVVRSFRLVSTDAKPMRSFGTFSFADRDFVRFEAMEVPLAADGRTVDVVLGIAVTLREARA